MKGSIFRSLIEMHSSWVGIVNTWNHIILILVYIYILFISKKDILTKQFLIRWYEEKRGERRTQLRHLQRYICHVASSAWSQVWHK